MAEELKKTRNLSAQQKTMLQIFEEYVLWFAMPSKAKEMMGIETDLQFSAEFGVSNTSLSLWKDRPEFEAKVRQLRRKWAFEKTGQVIEGMYRAAVRGNDRSQKLWMQVFEGFTEKTETVETKKVELTINDIRFLLDGFPVELRQKFYGYITEIIDTGIALRNARRLEDGTYTDNAIEREHAIPTETDNDARNISDIRVNEIPESDTPSVCIDVGENGYRPTCASENNYQSTSRRWKK